MARLAARRSSRPATGVVAAAVGLASFAAILLPVAAANGSDGRDVDAGLIVVVLGLVVLGVAVALAAMARTRAQRESLIPVRPSPIRPPSRRTRSAQGPEPWSWRTAGGTGEPRPARPETGRSRARAKRTATSWTVPARAPDEGRTVGQPRAAANHGAASGWATTGPAWPPLTMVALGALSVIVLAAALVASASSVDFRDAGVASAVPGATLLASVPSLAAGMLARWRYPTRIVASAWGVIIGVGAGALVVAGIVDVLVDTGVDPSQAIAAYVLTALLAIMGPVAMLAFAAGIAVVVFVARLRGG